MSHLNPGLISAYNSLTDKHLAGYFSNTRIRRHLQRAGLITRSGRIVPDKEYRHRLSQRQHQRHVRECLAQAIFHKRDHQIEIKRKLEEFAKRERVHKIKLERSKRYEEDFVRVLSPRPPTGARVTRKQRSAPEGDRSESSESPGSSRPNTAPGKMHRPVRLKPLHSNRTTASLRRSSPYRPPDSFNENDQPLSCTMKSNRRLTGLEASRGISPYCLPVINTFVTPVPPPTKRKELEVKVAASSAHRGRRLRPSNLTAAKVNEDPPMLKSSVQQSRVTVNMIYFGKKVHLSHDLHDTRDEVKVFQQHCGGENLCVYKGLLHGGETFQFVSRRHRGYPFSLTFFLNGLQVERLSSCCEFKHRRASRLRGRHRHFGFCSVEEASPCYKCIIAMGLDKQPTPPPKRVREDAGGDSNISLKAPPKAQKADNLLQETSQPEDVETPGREERVAVRAKTREGYEEDFEADDEGPADDADARENTSSSPQSQIKKRNVSETEDDGNDEDITSHHSSSCSSSSDPEESDAETDIERPKESDHEGTDVPPEERARTYPEETSEVEPKESEVQKSTEDSTETNISVSTGPSGTENQPNADTSDDERKMADESKQEEEQERAKSVQEKLAEAILKESQDSSEPELSDTSTEDEEDVRKRPEQDKKEEPVTGTEQKTEHEEDLGGNSMVQEEKEMPEDDMKQKPEENTGDSKATAGEAPSEEAENTSLPPASENKTEDKSSEIQQQAAAKDGTQTHEEGREAEDSEGDESSTPTPNEKAENETAMEDNAGAAATTGEETMEMKMELSEGQEALSSVEAPVADTEERPREDGEDGPTGPNAELTMGNGRNVLEESGGTEMSRDAPNAERDDKEETAGEETEQSVQTPDEVEEKSEGKDEEKQTEPEIGDSHSSEERRDEDAETKTNASVGADGTTDQSLKTNEGEDSACVKDGDEEDEKEATGVGETMSETCGEVKKEQTEEQTEAGEINTGNREKEEGGIPSAGELEKNTDADSAEEKKNPEGSTVEPDNELANIEVEETVREASGEEEKGEMDTENAETSSKAESVAQRDEEEAETAAHRCDEIKPDEEEGAVAKESTAESLDNKDKGDQLDPTPDAGSGDGPGPEIKETELEESCNVPQQDDEILTTEVLAEVTAEQSSTPVLLTGTAPTFDISIAMPESEEHPLSAVTDLTAVRGESGETEPSRASEEGASVVLNPQASFPDQEECRAANPEITEIVNTEENVDLVSNWVITHQVAKFFETFVEPLDDLKETQAGVTQHDQSAEPMSPVKPLKVVENEDQEQSKEEATELQQESNIFKTSPTREKEPEAGVQEATEVGDLRLGYEPADEELTKGLPAGSEGSRTSLQQVKDQEGFMENNAEQDRVSTPGVKDKAESHDSVTRGSVEHQSEQEDPDLKGKPTPVEEFRDQQAETEPHSQRSSRAEEPENAEEIWEVKEKTVAAELTGERTPGEAEERAPELPDTTDVGLIQDLRHSKDRLSVSSLNETHFGRSSYPLLAAVRTQNGQ
ncbi:glutamate-rich protein 3 isoform X2 [Takifugu flavidus]|uniref:glutamate-rich protein 3 isoform X2 n=1 Tax=Takifugu flavidus TaxID=433684 RepID=UPI002544B6BC|nr:glutamate-rich protein 3 isoform X2 [Takifugu flavidus]